MYYDRVEDTFSAAHYLRNYHGKCERLHGHNYRVRVTVRGEKLDEGGMLVDFTVMKKKLKEVLSLYDHMNLNEVDDFREAEPSAERIAKSIFDRLSPLMPEVEIDQVEVFETDKNLAIYKP